MKKATCFVIALQKKIGILNQRNELERTPIAIFEK